jgi:hypothetical protein|nr:MAG TPA_asm: hypothetical protein [Caudoviricetes sp.]
MSYLRVLIIGLISYLGVTNYVLRSKVNSLDNDLSKAKNNIEAYQSMLNNQYEANRVLQLDISDFKHSNDSLIQELSKVQDQLKIKDKKLKEVMSMSTVLTDTIVNTIPVDRNFYVELQSNPLTTIKINRMDSVITCIPEIYNHQDLFITEEKVYRKKYKNWFQRLIHFDFKKDKVESYKIINSNDLIRVLDTRVIKITK